MEMRFPETKSGKAHVVPLSPPAMTILGNLPRRPGNDFVFCGRKPGRPLANIDGAWRRVRERAKLPDVRLHDLRRSVASWMAQSGAPLLVVKNTLGHSSVKVTEKVYAQIGQNPVRKALDDFGRQVLAAAGKEEPQERKSGEVIAFDRAG